MISRKYILLWSIILYTLIGFLMSSTVLNISKKQLSTIEEYNSIYSINNEYDILSSNELNTQTIEPTIIEIQNTTRSEHSEKMERPIATTRKPSTQGNAIEGKTTTAATTNKKDDSCGGFKAYNIPISKDLQEYTYKLCRERGVEYELVLALMFAESSYRSGLVSSTNDYGIMQINKCNHAWLKRDLGITDFLDPKQNINGGTYMLSKLAAKYPNTHKMLMAYNAGEGGAAKLWNDGIYSTLYSRKIVGKAEEIRNGC
jgi:hypothetical protein